VSSTSLPSLRNSFRLSILAGALLAASLGFAADSRAATIGAGEASSCGISPSGALTCWGYDHNIGALGTGENRTEDSYDPLPVKGLDSGVTDISLTASGGFQTTVCAIASGGARCWGDNDQGQFGNGTKGGTSNTPVQVSGLESGVTKISVNTAHVCAVHNGAAKCWGAGDDYRLGTGSGTDQPSPVTPQGLASGVTDIAAGRRHTCAIKDGTIYCWGNNTNYQLGFDSNGQPAHGPTLMAQPPPGRAVGITAGSDHSCALMDSGAVYCWGTRSDGRLGDGSSTDKSANPLLVTGMDSGVSAIHSNYQHTCAIKSGTAFCWGDGGYGRLGNGAESSSSVPVQVSNISGVTSIAGGRDHTCAVASDKQYCWGRNSHRQLGSNRVGERSAVPVEVTGTKPAPGPDPGPGGATNGDDVLNGTAAADKICGLFGNDIVNGLAGNDTLFGDACDDKTKRLFGAQATTDGNDKLNGGDGNDTMYGAGGKDTMKGGKGKDKLFGGDGNDTLSGEAGSDSLDGGRGNDKLTGGADVNKYKGGDGNDVLSARNGKKETVDCGKGSKDKATVDRTDTVKGCETVSRPRR
jgi:alpha-tubulin suppressor-like RCC1 family protein